MADLSYECPECSWSTSLQVSGVDVSERDLAALDDRIDRHHARRHPVVVSDDQGVVADGDELLLMWSARDRGVSGVVGRCVGCGGRQWFPQSDQGEVLVGVWVRNHVQCSRAPGRDCVGRVPGPVSAAGGGVNG